jgi:hypothetical protein
LLSEFYRRVFSALAFATECRRHNIHQQSMRRVISGTMCDCQWSCTHRERFTGNPFSAMRKTHSIVKKIMTWKKNDRKIQFMHKMEKNI